jgi:hypothetical protein
MHADRYDVRTGPVLFDAEISSGVGSARSA